jgi:broad specificity phosphatase PhoE
VTTLHYVRHGCNDWLGKGIAGRATGVHLNEEGRRDAERAAAYLAKLPIRAVYASPLERAQETAEPIAAKHHLPIHTAPELQELDFGDWNGSSFEELDADPRWKPFNYFRIGNRAPNGELMLEVQARMVLFAERMCRNHPDQDVVLVSHGDPIKSVLCHFLGLSLDMFERLEVAPGSVNTLEIGEWGSKLLKLNA